MKFYSQTVFWLITLKTCREISSVRKNLINLTRDYTCKICTEKFPFKFVLQNHLLTHTIPTRKNANPVNPAEKIFNCDFPGCSKMFKHKRSQQNHMVIHKAKEIICDLCGLLFTTKFVCKEHIMKIHIRGKTHRCVKCSKLFYDNTKLKLHLLSHAKVGQYECTECEEPTYFKDRVAFKTHEYFKHELNLTKIKQQCCDKKFQQRAAFQKHLLSHEPVEGFAVLCECLERFTSINEFKEHQKRGGITKTFKCARCQKLFSLLCVLEQHEREYHNNEPFHCQKCPLKFQLLDELQIHAVEHL